MIRILKYLKAKEMWLIAVCIAFVVLQVWLDLELIDYTRKITVYVTGQGGAKLADIMSTGGLMLLCAVGSLASAIIVGFFSARVAASFSRRLRSMIFNRVEAFSMEEINKFSTASLITRSTNDITQIQMVVSMGLQILIKAPIMAVWAMCKIAGSDWRWMTATGISIFLIAVMIGSIMVFVIPRFKKVQKLTDNINKITRENLTGLRVVRAYNAENYQQAKFDKANVELVDNNLVAHRIMAGLQPIMSLLLSVLTVVIYWIGMYLINKANAMDKIPLYGEMIVFSAYAMQIGTSFIMMIMIFIMLPRATVSARRIIEVLKTSPTINGGSRENGHEGMRGDVEFRNVSFKYPDAEKCVLEGISFVAHAGETVAFIGSTGSGKSTVINMIPRFYDATDGEILIDGINIKEYKLHSLHNKIGYVSQKAVIFFGNVASNVAYGDSGREIEIEDIKQAVSIAQGADFVENMDGEYYAPIAQGGSNISGGQKQRLAIARAICRKPEIFIFDDSFSALDYRTDRELRTALKENLSGATNLIVAQRIGTIKDADRIIVLDEGRIVGNGTHEELLKSCRVYQEIAYSQLSKEEL